MKVEIPTDANELTQKIYKIMNSDVNGIHQVYRKNTHLHSLYREEIRLNENIDHDSLKKEITTQLINYIKSHIEKFGFFSNDVVAYFDADTLA